MFDGLGELPGEYTIQIKHDAMPVVNPHADYQWHCEVWSKLNWMQWHKQIITPVTEPTKWVSSMVVAQKKNEKVCICLDLQHLNKVVMRSHYPLSTIKEVANRLTNAKVFTVLDFGKLNWLKTPVI